MVLKDVDTEEVKIFATGFGYPSIEEGIDLLRGADWIAGHNIINFDGPVLNRLHGAKLDPNKYVDTLVCSRLFNSWDYSSHGLEDWGERLGYPKIHFKDFEKLSLEMIEYCVGDVELNYRLYKLFEPLIFNEKLKKSLRVEHDCAIIFKEMNEGGFGFDVNKAKELKSSIEKEKAVLDELLQSSFPPKPTFIKEVFPKLTKDGRISVVPFKFLNDKGTPEENGYQPNAPFSLIEYVEFNPASPKQRIEVLNEAGWKPFEKTKGHAKALKDKTTTKEKLDHYKVYGWQLSEDNLDTLPEEAPLGAKSLKRWLLLDRRILTLEEWIGHYRPSTGSIHGSINHIGAWTHRVSHTEPNTGNITRIVPGKDGKPLFGEEGRWGAEFRSLWIARPGYKLVGCDAEGIQLRVLAHYMEDEEFTKAVVSGSSKDGTDVHTMNQKKLNKSKEICKTRNDAKTFIYAWLLGSGVAKTAQILKCSVADAAIAQRDFLEGYPGLKRVKEEIIPRDAANGQFIGFDGRPVVCDSEYYMLAGYLQNGEACIMKHANTIWQREVKKLGIPFHQVGFIHDEFQTEVLDQFDYPDVVGKIQAQSITQAGIELGVKCPQAGAYRIGEHWLATH